MEFAPHVKKKACEHGVLPWTECPECTKPGTFNCSAHFAHNGQWTLRQQEQRDRMAVDPFGNIAND